MIEKIVNKLLDTQIKSGLLKDETIPIYRYGYTLLIEVTINVILSLVIGFALGEIGIVILFNLIFSILYIMKTEFEIQRVFIIGILIDIFNLNLIFFRKHIS